MQGAGQVTVKLDALIVAGAMSSEKVAVTPVLVATPVVGPGLDVAGTVSVTLGRVVSVADPVVNVQTKFAARGTPAVSIAPVVIVAVQIVPAGSGAAGVNVAVRLAAT